MKSIVISIKENNDKRRNHIQSEFKKKEIKFEFFDAITPNKLDSLIKKYNIKINNDKLTKGEIACFISHISVWLKIINEDIRIASIFEDDIYLSSTANETIYSKKIENINFDIIKLEKSLDYISISYSHNQLSSSSKVSNLKSEHLGSAGYILTKEAAKKLLDYIKQYGICTPVDILIFSLLLTDSNFIIKQVTPAVCIQDFILNKSQYNFPSLLEKEREKNYITTPTYKSKFILTRIVKEITRPFKKLYKKIHLSFKHKLNFTQ